MRTLDIIDMLDRNEKIDVLRHLLDEVFPADRTSEPEDKNGYASPMISEEPVDYEVIKPRTFQDYFKLNLPTAQIGTLLGYTYVRQRIDFSAICVSADTLDPDRLTSLLNRIEEGLQHVGMQSEMARREFLIAPLLLEVIHYTNAQLQVEYSIKASDSLQGLLDYLLMTQHQLLVIEAKNGDLQRGFHQLMAQLSALDRNNVSPDDHYYGIISMGDGWQFGHLDRQQQMIVQDTQHYGVPMNTALLIRIMIGILQGS